MGVFLFILTAGIIIIMALFVSYKSAQSNQKKWAETARNHGLKFVEASSVFDLGEIFGQLDGHKLNISLIKERHGKNQITYTQYQLTYDRSLPIGFFIGKENFFTSAVKIFGVSDIEVGDKEFDRMAKISTNSPEDLATFLNHSRKSAIFSILKTQSNPEITNSKIMFKNRGTDTGERLNSNILLIKSVAGALCKTDSEQFRGKANQGNELAQLRNEIKKPNEKIKIPLNQNNESTQNDYRKNQYDRSEIEDFFKQSDSANDVFKTKSKTIELAKNHQQKPDMKTALETNLQATEDQQNFISAIFSDRTSRFQAIDIFDKEFKGKNVNWNGILKTAENFSYNIDFPALKEGIKLEVAIGQVEDFAGKKEILAILGTTRDKNVEQFLADKGKSIHFSGRLLKADPFSYKILVQDSNT